MKTLAAAAALLSLFATSSIAVAEPLSGADLSMDRAVRKEHRGRGLTIAGVVQIAVGTALLVAPSLQRASCHGCGEGVMVAGELVAGSFALISGGIEAAVGIPTWVIGDKEEKRIQQTVAAGPTGLRVTF